MSAGKIVSEIVNKERQLHHELLLNKQRISESADQDIRQLELQLNREFEIKKIITKKDLEILAEELSDSIKAMELNLQCALDTIVTQVKSNQNQIIERIINEVGNFS